MIVVNEGKIMRTIRCVLPSNDLDFNILRFFYQLRISFVPLNVNTTGGWNLNKIG